MKKVKIFITCLYFLFLALFFYNYYDNSISVFWLIGGISSIFISFVAWAIIEIIEKKKSRSNIFFSLCAQLLFLGYFSYQATSRYDRNVCQAKFGQEFNARRRSEGIPIIPANWRIKYSFTRSVTWQAKDSVIGHESKDISIDPTCAIKYEEDEYDLKPLHGKERDLSIHFKYARGKAKDSTFYRYNDGDTTRDVSRQQADSIFAAEKIKMDY